MNGTVGTRADEPAAVGTAARSAWARFLLDVNVVLDILLDRRPYSESSLALWAAPRQAEIQVLFPAHGVTTVFHVLARSKGPALARTAVTDLLAVASIAQVDEVILGRALAFGRRDCEEAVCAVAGEAASCDLLVTRDPGGFKDSPVLGVDPATALSLLRGQQGPDHVEAACARLSVGCPESCRRRR